MPPLQGGSILLNSSYQARRDPNAMDIDALSYEKRLELRKEGKCYNCFKKGHLARDCPNRKGKKAQGTGGGQKKYRDPKEIARQIRALASEVEEDKKDELFATLEEEGGFL